MSEFKKLGLADPLNTAVEKLGFTEPTPIQQITIPYILESDNDLVALAQTGTGKTAAFGLPLIQKTSASIKEVQGLILCPTRELCMQITGDLTDFSVHSRGIKVTPVYGGAPIDRQIQQIRKGSQVIVGTPGRMRDLIERGVLKIDHIKWLVLDEADEMLQMGFKEELDAILKDTPSDKQTLLFSATMPSEVRRIASAYMHDPREFSVGKKNSGAEKVEHEYYVSLARHRYEVLKRISDMNPDIYGIVFCRTRRETKEVADKFMNDGYNADALHGDLSQAQRDYVMNRFRKRQIQMLVATDVAARGLDVDDLTHVINYNLPDELESYVHRSGRTGRAGRTGISVSILHTKEQGKIKSLEKIVGKKFTRKMVPAGQDICKKQLFSLINTMEHVKTDDKQIDALLPEIYEKLEWMSREELIKKFVSVEFNRFLEYYKNAPDLNAEPVKGAGAKTDDRRMPGKRENRNSNRDDMHVDYVTGRRANFTRFYINIGSKSNLNPTKLIGLLLDTTNNRQLNIGKIDIMKGFSFFEVEQEFESLVLKSFNKTVRRDGTRLRVEISNEKPGQNHPSRHAQFKRGIAEAKKAGGGKVEKAGAKKGKKSSSSNPYINAHRR